MTIEGESRMATATSSYTTASRYCQQLTDSPAPSPGLPSTVRARCSGHSQPPSKPDTVGPLLGELQGSHLFTLRAVRCSARSCCSATPPPVELDVVLGRGDALS